MKNSMVMLMIFSLMAAAVATAQAADQRSDQASHQASDRDALIAASGATTVGGLLAIEGTKHSIASIRLEGEEAKRLKRAITLKKLDNVDDMLHEWNKLSRVEKMQAEYEARAASPKARFQRGLNKVGKLATIGGFITLMHQGAMRRIELGSVIESQNYKQKPEAQGPVLDEATKASISE